MIRHLLAAGFVALSSAASGAPLYSLARSVTLGAPDRWDYLAFVTVPAGGGAAARDLILVAHEGEVTAVDARTLSVAGRLTPVGGAHGMAALSDGRIVADGGDDGSLSVFDGLTFRPAARWHAGADADAVAYEPVSKRVAVANGDPETLTLVDAATGAARTVALGGSPESIAADGAGAIFVNLASTGRLARVEGARVTAAWALPGCESPHGLALDPTHARAFVGCRNSVLMVVDTGAGRVLQSLPIGQGNDAAAFDAQRQRVFTSQSDGTISIFAEAGGRLTPLETLRTAPGARTMTLDPVSGALYTVTADVAGSEPGKHGGLHYRYVPGTLKLLVYKPAT